MKKFTLIACLLLFISGNIFSQHFTSPCATDQMVAKAIKENPELAKNLERLEAFTQEQQHSAQKNEGAKMVIPVVFHIIHEYGLEDIDKSQILDVMRIINEDFSNTNADASETISQFKSIMGVSNIGFRLARIDPDGQCTDGITRTVSSLTHNASDNVKQLISWDTKKYMNVWVVAKLANGAGGYAYYPGTAPIQSYEGIVVNHQQVGSIGTSSGSNFSRHTLSHEIGHYLNLKHVWGGGAIGTCGSDEVSDTPTTQGTQGQSCNKSQTTCGSLDNVQNIMDYSSCATMFTQGQVSRMETALKSLAGSRSSLWQQSNLVATGTNDGYNAPICPPIADFQVTTKQTCIGGIVKFYDLSYGSDIDNSWKWEWKISGPSVSTFTDQDPNITFDKAGKYSVTLKVTNSSGTDSKTFTNAVKVYAPEDGIVAPVVESMENVSFPALSSDPDKNWIIENSTSSTWHRTTLAAYTGGACAGIRNNTIPAESVNSLITPNIDVRQMATLDLTFKLAYARRNSESNDLLRVLVSKNCGQSWTMRYSRAGALLATNENKAFILTNFLPKTNEWREEKILLSPFLASTDNIMIKFEVTSRGGNYLYIDDVNLNGEPVGIENQFSNKISQFEVFPNPFDQDATISYHISSEEEVTLQIFDLVGKQIGLIANGKQQTGNYSYKLSDLTNQSLSGVYFVTLQTGDRKITKKIISLH